MEELKMYEYIKGDCIYYGNKECGSPIREIRTCTDKEAKFWDNLDKQIRRQKSTKYGF